METIPPRHHRRQNPARGYESLVGQTPRQTGPESPD
jgi:lipopolysaccharide transport system ATP-binding protein